MQIQSLLYSNIFLVDKVECNFDTDEGQKIFKDYNAMAIEKGFEGIMIKDRNDLRVQEKSFYVKS